MKRIALGLVYLSFGLAACHSSTSGNKSSSDDGHSASSLAASSTTNLPSVTATPVLSADAESSAQLFSSYSLRGSADIQATSEVFSKWNQLKAAVMGSTGILGRPDVDYAFWSLEDFAQVYQDALTETQCEVLLNTPYAVWAEDSFFNLVELSNYADSEECTKKQGNATYPFHYTCFEGTKFVTDIYAAANAEEISVFIESATEKGGKDQYFAYGNFKDKVIAQKFVASASHNLSHAVKVTESFLRKKSDGQLVYKLRSHADEISLEQASNQTLNLTYKSGFQQFQGFFKKNQNSCKFTKVL